MRLGAVLALLSPATALAQSCSTALTAVAFGVYRPGDTAPKNVTGNIGVECQGALLPGVTLLVFYSVTVGTGASGSYANRWMLGGADNLNYQLYRDSARTVVWGDGTGGTTMVNASWLLGILAPTANYPVYGRITAGQNVRPGTYTDLVTVTIGY